MPHKGGSEGYRVLACAPYGQDGTTIGALLTEQGYQTRVCTSIGEVAGLLDGSIGVVILTEEALQADLGGFRDALLGQPAWSEVPVILLAAQQSGRQDAALARRERMLQLVGNAIVLERPLGTTSLISATASAMRARQRQFQMRDHLVELDARNSRLAEAAFALESEVAARTVDLQQALERLREETAERERAESSLRQSQKMEAVGQLTGGIAHDFNNMLTGVMGSLDLMRRRIASGRVESLDRYMDAATTSAGRAAALTQRLLAFSRRQSLDAKAADVNEVIRSMHDLLDRATDEQVTLTYDFCADLPYGFVDPNQLENAILNLVINSRDAMPDGGRVTIRTQAHEVGGASIADAPDVPPGRYVTVAVSDTGVGMDADLLDKVFDPFFTTKPMGQGTGLGLSMVYGFAQQSGGVVKLASTVGVGTTVTLWLPTSHAPVSAQTTPRTPVSLSYGRGQRVLVVEDDHSVRMVVREVLEELGYHSVEFADPMVAVPFLASDEPIDLMISDVGMPGMNGRELAEIARAARPDLPILFVTGYAENAVIRADFLGANMGMITKPFRFEDLAAKIGEMVGAD